MTPGKISFVWGLFLLTWPSGIDAENIDPYDEGAQFAYGENTGWLNFEPLEGEGAQVSSQRITGFIWAENLGWINLSCETTHSCGTVDFGVVNDGQGNLSGYGWGENIGWVNFSPRVPDDLTSYGTTLDIEGRFSGWAWGENVGWIQFDSTQAYDVLACKVTLDDLVRIAQFWLQTEVVPADLDQSGQVEYGDFARLAALWLDFCPDGWQLKWQ